MSSADDQVTLIDNAIESILTLRDDLTAQQEHTRQRLQEIDDLLHDLRQQREQLQEIEGLSKAATAGKS